MVEIPALELDGRNWKIYRTRILEVAATLEVLKVLTGLEKDNGSNYWLGQDTKARFLIYSILPPQLLDSILQLDTAHEMFVYLERKFHDTGPIKRDAKKKVETCANDEVSKGQSGSASSRAAETYQTVERASIAAESPESLPTSGDGQKTYRDENVWAETMRKRPKTFAGTCHKCGEVGHKACNCRRSVDLPKCSAKEAATTTDGQAKTRGHDPCYNPEKKLSRGSERESVAVERPTNALECVVDGQGTDLLREVSDNEEKDLLNRPDGSREPQDELQELQSLPVEGESRDSKRQVAKANAKAADTSGRAKVVGKAADVEGKALPGRVDKAKETPDGRQSQPQQAELYCKGSQLNENAESNIPSTHGVPLEGEWSMCASGRVMDSLKVSASGSNANSSSRPGRLASVDETELRSCGRGMGECTSVDEWCWPVEKARPIVRIPKGYCQLGRRDGNASCKETSANGQGESGKLVPTTVELDDPGGSETPRVCLEGTKTRVGEVESHRSRADKSRGQANESRGQVDASTVLNTRETVAMGDGGGTGVRLDAGGARRDGAGPDGHANWSDVSSGHRDVPGIRNGTNTTADATETINTRQNAPKMQNLPIKVQRRDEVEPRSRAGMPNTRVDTQGIAIHANTAGDTQKSISTRTEGMKPSDLPTGSTRPCRDGTNGLESHADTQMARIHVQDIANKSNKPANMSVTQDLPASGTELCMGEPNRLERQTDTSDTCTRMQRVAHDSRKPTDKLERVRKSQNGCKKSNLPAKSLKTRPEEPEKPGNHADASNGRVHVQSGQIDAKMTARTAKAISTSPNEQNPPNSPIGAGCWCRNEADGSGNVADASTTRRGMHSDRNGARTTAKTRKTISKPPNKPKMPNSPVGAKIRRIGEADGLGNHADGSNVCWDTQRAGTDVKTAENMSKKVKTCQVRPRRPNSPCRVEIQTPKRPERWKHISNHGNDGYAPQIMLIKDLGTRNRKIAFG